MSYDPSTDPAWADYLATYGATTSDTSSSSAYDSGSGSSGSGSDDGSASESGPGTAAGAATQCLVPKLRGTRVKAARLSLKSSGCRVGKIKRVHKAGRRGRVLRQSVRAGKTMPVGTRVNLRVGR
jgi:hypothetical protein